MHAIYMIMKSGPEVRCNRVFGAQPGVYTYANACKLDLQAQCFEFKVGYAFGTICSAL